MDKPNYFGYYSKSIPPIQNIRIPACNHSALSWIGT